MEHFVSKLGRLLLFEGISCTCYFTTGFPAKWVSQLVSLYIASFSNSSDFFVYSSLSITTMDTPLSVVSMILSLTFFNS